MMTSDDLRPTRQPIPFLSAAAILALALTLILATPRPAQAAAMVVTTVADTVAVDATCSLREAMQNAIANDGANVDCAAGEATGDTITFDPTITGGTITLTSAFPTVTVNATDSTIIDGNGRNITISGNNAFRGFQVNGGGGGAGRPSSCERCRSSTVRRHPVARSPARTARSQSSTARSAAMYRPVAPLRAPSARSAPPHR